MKRTISFLNKEVATAALEDAKNFSIVDAMLQEKDGQIEISFGSYECCEPKGVPAPITWADLDSIYSSVRRDWEYEIKWLREDMNYNVKRFNDHMKGHLPPILDAGKLEGAIKALGMSDSYKVEKATVTVDYY